jgi:hypothetical protein
MPKYLQHNDPADAWAAACERATRSMEMAHANYKGETAIEEAQRLLGLAHHLSGVACPQCGGEGRRGYASTSTWRGGAGGQAITEGVCDVCWGTGRTDRTGVNLRKLHSEHYTLDARLLRWRELARKMADLISTACPDSSVWTDVGGLGDEYDRLEAAQTTKKE